MLALEEVDPLGLHPIARTDHSVHIDDQPHSPLSPRQVANPSLAIAVELANPDAAAPAGVENVCRVERSRHVISPRALRRLVAGGRISMARSRKRAA
jgi:hypothetical protein